MQPDDQNLDRVRDARGDGEVGRCEECGHLWSRHRGSVCLDCEAARSPQGEDHEAGIEAFREVLFKWQPPLRDILDDTALDEAIDAYLSRVSSSRDGTVAVEDLRARLNEMALVDDTGDSHDEGYMAAVDEMRAWLVGESNEGGNQ